MLSNPMLLMGYCPMYWIWQCIVVRTIWLSGVAHISPPAVPAPCRPKPPFFAQAIFQRQFRTATPLIERYGDVEFWFRDVECTTNAMEWGEGGFWFWLRLEKNDNHGFLSCKTLGSAKLAPPAPKFLDLLQLSLSPFWPFLPPFF